MKVELINIPTEITDESLKQYLADISSVVRNKQPKDNDRLFQRLLKESFGNKPSRVFEYIPCNICVHTQLPKFNNYVTPVQLFGFSINNRYYTNARELMNWGWSWEEVINIVDFTHYKAVKCTAPYFIYGQVSSHTQITSVSHSNRYTESDLGYWMPEEVGMTQEMWNQIVPNIFPSTLQDKMKQAGITRREVYARGADMLQYRVFCLGGYLNNPNAWQHFVNQRLHDHHTQLETRQLTQMISDKISIS